MEKANTAFLDAQAAAAVVYGPAEAPKKKKTGPKKKAGEMLDPGDVAIARTFDGVGQTEVVASAAPEAAAQGRADAEAALELFAAECSVEDPVGTPVHIGRDAVEAFYRTGLAAITGTQLLGVPVVASEGPGAIAFRVELQLGDRAIALEVIDVMGFDEAGKFTSMRAFWGRDNRFSL